MKEQVLAMKSLWTEEEAQFHGQHVSFDASWAHPKPVQNPHPPILLGGETDYTLRRIVDYCDGWLPRARHGFDAAENMARLRGFAQEAGRDMSSLSVSVFGAPADAGVLESYREAGVDRALLSLPAAGRDEVLRILERYQPLL